MVFVGTKHNGFIHPTRLFQIGCDFVGHFTDAVFDDDVVIVVGIVIDAIFYEVTKNVTLTS